jgi:hypothetical protein
MKAIVVTDEAAGTAAMRLAERPEPPAAINDVIVQVHASGFVPTEMAWCCARPPTAPAPDRDRLPHVLRPSAGLIALHRPRMSQDGTHDEHPPASLMRRSKSSASSGERR